jgi:hypothetical protein
MATLTQLWLSHLTVKGEAGRRTWCCHCGKEWVGTHVRWNAYSHVDAHHLPHIKHKCDVCSEVYSVHTHLKNHYKTVHDSNYHVKISEERRVVKEQVGVDPTGNMAGAAREDEHRVDKKASFGQFLSAKLGEVSREAMEESDVLDNFNVEMKTDDKETGPRTGRKVVGDQTKVKPGVGSDRVEPGSEKVATIEFDPMDVSGCTDPVRNLLNTTEDEKAQEGNDHIVAEEIVVEMSSEEE